MNKVFCILYVCGIVHVLIYQRAYVCARKTPERSQSLFISMSNLQHFKTIATVTPAAVPLEAPIVAADQIYTETIGLRI